MTTVGQLERSIIAKLKEQGLTIESDWSLVENALSACVGKTRLLSIAHSMKLKTEIKSIRVRFYPVMLFIGMPDGKRFACDQVRSIAKFKRICLEELGKDYPRATLDIDHALNAPKSLNRIYDEVHVALDMNVIPMGDAIGEIEFYIDQLYDEMDWVIYIR